MSEHVWHSFVLHLCTREINRKLDAIGSLVCLSPEPQEPVTEYRNSPSPVNDYDDDDDIIIISSGSKRKRRRPPNTEGRDSAREISLKFRCRTELYKIPILSVGGINMFVYFESYLSHICLLYKTYMNTVTFLFKLANECFQIWLGLSLNVGVFRLQTAPLRKAVEQLAIKLNVTPSQILLLKKDIDLPIHSSVSELGLGIADIIGNGKQWEFWAEFISMHYGAFIPLFCNGSFWMF